MTSLRCSPHPTTAFVPRTDHECRTWDADASQGEILRLTDELAEELPDWTSTVNPSVSLNDGGLKAAAIKMASTPECVRRAVIKAYSERYGTPPDLPKLSGMYLLMRVLFVLPSDHSTTSNVGTFTPWSRPVVVEAQQTRKWNYQWPVHVNPNGHALEIERCQGIGGHSGGYALTQEYHWLRTERRFPIRSVAEIEVLEITDARDGTSHLRGGSTTGAARAGSSSGGSRDPHAHRCQCPLLASGFAW
jgi:hypothetical protein